nr:MAG TPA: hypothetical protein [Caudoviricetes sp.]
MLILTIIVLPPCQKGNTRVILTKGLHNIDTACIIPN